MRTPKYDQPSTELVDQAIQKASRFAEFSSPRLIVAETGRIVPRENVVLEEDLVVLMEAAPDSVPPIVIAPWGDVHVVVDGHHRLAAAWEAGHKSIWTIEVRLKRLKHLVWPEWYG